MCDCLKHQNLDSVFSLKCAYCMDFELNGGSKTTPAVTIYAGIAFCNEHYRIFRSLND